MNRSIGILLSVLLLVVMATSAVLAFEPGCGPNGRGAWMQELNLTPEQQQKMLEIRQNFAKETLPIRQELQKKALELRQLWNAEKPNEAAIVAKEQELVPLKVKLQLKMRAQIEAVKNVLTPEQQKKLEQLREKGPRHGRPHWGAPGPFGPESE